MSEISKEQLQKLIEQNQQFIELLKPKPEPPKPRTYKCTGPDCNFQTTDPDEYIHHRMGEVYEREQALDERVKKLENPPKKEHVHEWEYGSPLRLHCKGCGEIKRRE